MIFILIVALFSGCDKKEEEEQGTCVFYTNTEGTALQKECYEIQGETAEKAALNVLAKMKESPESIDLKPAIPEKVEVEGVAAKGEQMDVFFNRAYSEMHVVEETLCRAAVVQSLSQIEGIELVRFYVDGKPLADRSGKEIGFMQAENFVENTGSTLKSYEKTTLTLYFANKKGDKLKKETREVRHDSNTSVERLIIEQLMKGPEDGDAVATIPPKTKLLSVSVKDSVCYINFDEGFLEPGYHIKPEITIYSIVNSITNSGNASKAQISVNSGTKVKFQGVISLEQPIERNLDLVEEKGQ